MPIVYQVFAGVCALLAVAGAAYYALCAWAGLRFISQIEGSAAFAPPVSILKSLKGVDPHIRRRSVPIACWITPSTRCCSE